MDGMAAVPPDIVGSGGAGLPQVLLGRKMPPLVSVGLPVVPGVSVGAGGPSQMMVDGGSFSGRGQAFVLAPRPRVAVLPRVTAPVEAVAYTNRVHSILGRLA